jgi:hypothetical protein
MLRILIPVCSAVLLLITGCSTENDNPAAAVERYLTAKVAGDRDTLRELLCSEREADLNREAASFASVTDASIQDMRCELTPDSSNTVTCAGQITATYGTEQTSFPLTSYRVVQEDGIWKWCGEAG